MPGVLNLAQESDIIICPCVSVCLSSISLLYHPSTGGNIWGSSEKAIKMSFLSFPYILILNFISLALLVNLLLSHVTDGMEMNTSA
jgi:hypothetical protein